MESRKLVLVGGGGHCRSVLDTVVSLDKYEMIVIVDPNIQRGTRVAGYEVVGDDSQMEMLFQNGFKEAFITVGSIRSTDLRRRLFEHAEGIGFDIPNIIDPSAALGGFVKMGRGIFVGKQAVVNTEVEIGDGAIINSAAVVEHECRIGAFSHIAVGALVCGQSLIGDDVLVGAGSTVIQGLHIGNHAIIGAGSTVLGNVEDGVTVYGLHR